MQYKVYDYYCDFLTTLTYTSRILLVVEEAHNFLSEDMIFQLKFSMGVNLLIAMFFNSKSSGAVQKLPKVYAQCQIK